MAVIGNALFMRSGGGDVRDVIRHVEGQLSAHVDAYNDRDFEAAGDDTVVRALVPELTINPIEVDHDRATKAVEETNLSVSDHFHGTVQVPGLRVTKTLPFTGDPDLWSFGAGQWSSVMPRGEVFDRTVTVGMEVRANDGESAAAYITSTIEQIRHYVELQKNLIEPFNASLPDLLLPLVKARRARRSAGQSLLDKF